MPIEHCLIETLPADKAWQQLANLIDHESPNREAVEIIKASLELSDADIVQIATDFRLAHSLAGMIDDHTAKPSTAQTTLSKANTAVERHEAARAAFLDEWNDKARELTHAVSEAQQAASSEEQQITNSREELRDLREKYPALLSEVLTEQEQVERTDQQQRNADLDALAWRVVRGVDETLDTSGEMNKRLVAARQRLEHLSRDGGRVVRDGKFPATLYYIERDGERFLLSWAIALKIERDWQHINEQHRVTKPTAGDIELPDLRAIELGEVAQ